jgi:PadR family transcriptional regulator PadR
MGHLYRFVEPVLLLVLKEKGRSYGYDLAAEIPRHAFTDAAIEKAVLYRTLRTLERNGYVTSDWESDGPGPARRVYSLTHDGEEHLQEWKQVLTKVSGSMARFIRHVDLIFEARRGEPPNRDRTPAKQEKRNRPPRRQPRLRIAAE